MNLTHNGKIGRLPKAVQEQLNRRIANGEKGGRLVAWLNSLPEVQAVVAAEFGGKAMREQNLSEWRKSGYTQWLRQQEVLEMARQLAAEAGELQPAGAPPLTDQMAVWVTARYLVAIRKLLEKSAGGELDLKVLRQLQQDLVALRRGDHSGARLKLKQERLAQERLEREREQTEEEGAVAYFQRWADNTRVREAICGKCLSDKERAARIREIYGRPPEPEEEAVATAPESNPVQPSPTESDPSQPNPT